MSEPRTALVIDDEPVVRDAALRILRDEGWTVVVVPDGETALAHPVLETCALVLCDLMLPGRDGCEIVAEVRARRPEVPILLITGYATPENTRRAIASGATEVLAKPFDVPELLDQVSRVLSRTHAAGKETES